MSEHLYSFSIVGYLKQKLGRSRDFSGSADYWEERYADGGNSGSGSYHELARFKAEVLNELVADRQFRSVIEFGCGDGHQLSLMKYPQYTGLDVSKTAVQHCIKQYAVDTTKSFFLYDSLAFADNHVLFQADLSLSLDVLYHLVEDTIYDAYLAHLFQAGKQMVIIYSQNTPQPTRKTLPHVRLRHVTQDVEQRFARWELTKVVENRYPRAEFKEKGSDAHFYIYEPKP